MYYLKNEPFNDDLSKAFLLGLYLGLLLFLVLSSLDPNHESALHKATNIYGIQALAGAVLGFWRIRSKADSATSIPAVASVWICIGLALWAIAQALWMWASFAIRDVPYPWWSDIFYITSNLCWLAALWTIYRSLGRRGAMETSTFVKALIPIGVSLLLTGLPGWINRRFNPGEFRLSILICDFVYILLTVSGMTLALGLVLGENDELPYPLHQCIRYLGAATVIDALAIVAFTATEKLPPGAPFSYYNGNWVDWLFLTAMYCWGVSALKCPMREEDLNYTYQTSRSGVRIEDIYRANDIARARNEIAPLVDSKSIPWILDTIPGCWRVVKLGQRVVGSTFLFPVPQDLMKRFCLGQMRELGAEEQREKERQMFEEVKQRQANGESLGWDCLYLADASILRQHRRRGLTFRSFRRTIENIAEEHHESEIKVYCWPNTLDRAKLTQKLREHFKERDIPVIDLD